MITKPTEQDLRNLYVDVVFNMISPEMFIDKLRSYAIIIAQEDKAQEERDINENTPC